MRISDWSSDVCSSDLVGKSGLQELRKRSAQWLRRGAPVELLDASQTLEKTGTAAFTGSLLDRRAGTIQPLAYARGLARAAMAAGAVLHPGSRVQVIGRAGPKWQIGRQSCRGRVCQSGLIPGVGGSLNK